MIVAGGVTGAGQALASDGDGPDVAPVLVAGNPTCTELGFAQGFRIDPPNSGTYAIDAFNTVTLTSDGTYFDWTSTLGIDAVISKGGNAANVYVYDPPQESFGDDGLRSPNNASGGPAGLSHVDFCFDYELEVTKTATTTFTRTFGWDVAKSVTPATWNLFSGDSGTSEYTVSVTKSAPVDSDWAVSGTISVRNPAARAATVTGVSDSISGVGPVTADCGVTFPYTLGAGATLTCTYATALPDGTDRVNTATATTTGAIGGDSGTADVTFGAPTTVVDDSITVDDSNGSSWAFSDSGSVAYSRTFSCDGDEGRHDNTATIRETGASADAAVTVSCYDLAVTKNAVTSLTRTWDWTIDKTGDEDSLTLSHGQEHVVGYRVTANASSTDSNHAARGDINIVNPAPVPALISSVNDLVSPAVAATVDCGVTFPHTLPAGSALACTYVVELPDADTRTNTATATLQNHAYDKAGNRTPSGTTHFSGTAGVDFSNAVVTEVDECIEVSDTNVGALGTVCAGDAPKTFTYSLTFGTEAGADVVLECGDNTHVNTASFVTGDTGATGEDTWTVDATVACDTGCSLSQGYWKTHSSYGPATYDSTWALLPQGADTPFYLSGKTYYQVLWTPPQGNPYYNLAHQYIAAELNALNGAGTSSVSGELASAKAFFQAKAPTVKLTNAEKSTVLGWASTLEKYNTGKIGPGHCSE